MSADAEPRKGELPGEWERLERAIEEAAVSLGRSTRRVRESEEEVAQLRRTLEELSSKSGEKELLDEVTRLRAENAALRSRMLQARKRVHGLMQRLSALEIE